MKKYCVSIDLGGTKVLIALIDEKNKIVQRHKIPTETDIKTQALFKKISDNLNFVLLSNNVGIEDLKFISIGVPGTVDIEAGKIINAPNLKVKNFEVRKELKKYFPDTPVFLENDVNMTALGIARFEFKDKLKNAIVVSVGTGIGSAFIFDKKLYRGSSYFAGEIGHIKIDMTNSSSKTFENIASRTAMVTNLTEDYKNGAKTILTPLFKEGKKIKSKSLADAVIKNDELTLKHLKHSCKIIGNVLGNIATLLNIDTIILGGGVIQALGDKMLPEIKANFSKAALNESGKIVKIKITKLGDDAPLMGGIALAEEFIPQ